MGLHNKFKAGDRRGSLTLVAHVGGTSRHPRYRVRCDCGNEYEMNGGSFSNGGNCRECCSKGAPPKYGAEAIGGDSLYNIWTGMRYRCRTDHPKNKSWNGRGIKVCEAWDQSFDAFRTWALANGYEEGLTIDRVKSNQDYTPQNCEWVTKSVNSKRARADHRMIRVAHIGGETQWL